MAKNKIACALSATALTLGSGILTPLVFADGGDPFCIDGGDCYGTLQAAFDQVPSDGTLTTIYLNGDESTVYDGGGAFYTSGKGAHPANGNYNVVFDLKGKTYVIEKDPVGSTGYETQAFHLEKGGKFTFKDGTVKAASGSGVWFILQNYADTVLDNVTLDGSDNPGITYVASNNFGSLTVKGESQILASEGRVAFDLWYGMSSVYDDGITVTFGDDFTGKVVGKVEYGHHSRVTDSNWREKAVLNISNGDFDIVFQDGSTGALNDANINISGGVFSSPFDPAYLAGGYSAYEKPKDVWTVDLAEEATLPEKIVIAKGETYTIEPGETIAKYLGGGIKDREIAESDGLTITGVAAGETVFTVQLYEMGKGLNEPIPVYVYDVADESADVRVEVTSDEMQASDVEERYPGAVDKLTEAAEDKEVAAFYDIEAALYSGDDRIESMSELGSAALVTFDLPEELPAVAEGLKRNFFMIRFHDGEASDLIPVIDNGDGTGSFENAEFSAFVLVYEDVEEPVEEEAATPETGTVTAAGASASVAAIAAVATVGILTSIAGFAYLIRRKR